MTRIRFRRPRHVLTLLPSLLCAALVVALAGGVVTPAPASRAAAFSAWSPIGRVEASYSVPGGVRFMGWDLDPSNPSVSLRTWSSVDGHANAATLANGIRTDVAARYPHAGPRHGFSWVAPVPEGQHTVCLWAQNFGAGSTTRLACASKNFDYGPTGSLDSVTTPPGSLHITGWSFDVDAPAAPVVVVISVDGYSYVLPAQVRRPDLARRVPASAGTQHGFDVTYQVAQGVHRVCVTGVNVGYGSDNALGCRTVTLNDDPIGKVEVLAQQADKVRLRGWALDNDQPTTAVRLSLVIDGGTPRVITANLSRSDIAAAHPGAGPYHGFDQLLSLREGRHTICLTATNIGYGSNVQLACKSVTLSFTPTAAITGLTAIPNGATLSGWATDPDTSSPISVRITIDGQTRATVYANGAGSTQNGHNFIKAFAMTSGTHTLCAIGLNVLYGTSNSTPACRTITLALSPIGQFENLVRVGSATDLTVTGWAVDPDTSAPLTVTSTVDGAAGPSFTADTNRPDIGSTYPTLGANHGLAVVIPSDTGEHTVCLTARNVGGGSDLDLGCKTINAVNPVVPTVPRNVTAAAGYGSATISWVGPLSDGGAPWTKFIVTASPGGRSVAVPATATTATITGLTSGAAYTFSVQAVNVAGASPAGVSPAVTTLTGPPPQTTPAPVSTSRYIRNIRAATSTELATLRAEGAADATANPSGHNYLILLDIGGQDQYNGGVVLSATTRFVSYGALQANLRAYVDGYHSAQRSTAPVMIAVGTNNDMNVSYTAGQQWASQVVAPLASYAARYGAMRVAGANDIEPGFRATYPQTRSWLSGYLATTGAPFVFNGSADGCAWTVTNRGCNNGWSMSGLYTLAAGAAPTRSLNLPQIYNYTMADQWKYISLTGVVNGSPRINFGGPLTEWTACAQSGGCGSISGVNAWSRMWSNLQSDARLRVSSLPYATDLRIDR
ncbi:MAG TPA: fibronectin type III domain-containing protein [Jatrophihabitans sp.]|jgi:hypothetical protein|uniref:fibronectin type III domain-containing protein n=1 Tax=Jatrophihabitans sp. TaxID=1932789 RepID=UPI002DFD88DC|nr:fibronectin type III domain-containing protein [Jatrophihabitans sp.]